MALQLTNCSAYVDSTVSAGVPFLLATVRVTKIRWVSPLAGPTDVCTLQDATGKNVWGSSASGPSWVDPDNWLDPTAPFIAAGLQIGTLSSGYLFIWFSYNLNPTGY